jgi:hypothetical protein
MERKARPHDLPANDDPAPATSGEADPGPEARGEAFIARFMAADGPTRERMRAGGVALAEELRSRAVGLAYSRATEFSPALPLCHMLAAKVALLVHGPDSERLRGFEADIACFRDARSTKVLILDFDRFRATFAGSPPSASPP